MPIYQEWSPNEHSLAAIWKIEEPEAFFLELEVVRNAARIEHIKHPRRRIEHLAGRFLLNYLQADFPLHHIANDLHDKPRLPDNQYFFSISHSYPYVAVLISDKEECGIDIQIWKDGIEKIVDMFLSAHEQTLCEGDSKLFTLAWCIKEATYKWNGRRGADFIRDLGIQQIKLNHILSNWEGLCEEYAIKNNCFTIPLECNAVIYKDFSLAWLIRERIHIHELVL